MKIAAQVIGYPILGILYAGIFLLFGLYFIDFLHELFTEFRWLLLIIMFFFGSMVVLVVYWGAVLAMIPLSMATHESSGTKTRLTGLVLIPFGLVAGFMLWQVQNWFFFGVLDIEPWAYNGVFRHIGLAI